MSNTNDVVRDCLSVAVATRTPVLLWGSPGSGKTATVTALASALGLACEVVIASIHEPTDFSGLPVVSGDTVRLAPPRWARRLADTGGRGGLLFLDELSTAPPAVQAALLRVVLEKTVGDLPLSPDIAVVAAANPPEQAADGWDLSAPLANRFCHLTWSIDSRSFSEGLVSGWHAQATTVPVPPDWEGGLPVQRALVAGFVRSRPDLVSAVPDGAAAGRAWPSPRSWELGSRLLAAAVAAGCSYEVRAALLAGTVGDGAALEFAVWAAHLDLPDPEDVLCDPEAIALPVHADRIWALLAAVSAAVATDPTARRWDAGCRLLGRVAATHPDAAAMAGRALVRCQPPGTVAPAGLRALGPVLRQAGLLGAA